MYAPSQREVMLHCKVASHWLGECTKWSLLPLSIHLVYHQADLSQTYTQRLIQQNPIIPWCNKCYIYTNVANSRAKITRKYRSGGWFNMKMLSYQHRNPHCGDKYHMLSYDTIRIVIQGLRGEIYHDTYRWFGARLQWLRCVSNGVTAVLY